MATIYWRNGWAWARAKVKGVDRREPLGTRSKEEAKSRFQTFVANLEKEKDSKWTGKETPFPEAVRLFTEEHLPNLKPASQERYLVSLLVLTPHFEEKTLQNLSRVDLATFVSERRKQGVSDSTIRRDLSCLSSVYTICADFELCDANPVLPFLRAKKRTKALVEADSRTRYLSHAEELLILTKARENAEAQKPGSPRWLEKWMILAALGLYLDTGLRGQELLKAQWSWVNLDQSEIVLPKEFAKNGQARTVPLLPRAVKILRQLPRNEHTDYILWRCESGKRFKDLNKTFQAIARIVGITDVHIHDLRRTNGCRLLQDHRVSMEVVSKWLGHSSVVLTEKVYAFLKVENLHEAIGTRRGNSEAKPKLLAFFDEPDVSTDVG